MHARQLIIMRHATAETGGGRDHARRLTTRGLDEAHRVGVSLASTGPIPEHVLCSSAARCHETWEAVAAGLDGRVTVDIEDELYNASAATLLDVLVGVVDVERILLLAHNPGVSQLALELGSDDESSLAQLRPGFSPATIACFEIDGRWSTLSSASARLMRFERVSEA
jgi:phosphohistidine phosphatase